MKGRSWNCVISSEISTSNEISNNNNNKKEQKNKLIIFFFKLSLRVSQHFFALAGESYWGFLTYPLTLTHIINMPILIFNLVTGPEAPMT